MLARAILTALAATATTPPLDEHPNDRVHNDGPKRIPLTLNEVQRLIAALISPVQASLGHVLHWSLWRRRAQTHARASHYRRQAAATGRSRSPVAALKILKGGSYM